MATIIDALIVELSLDPKQFTKGQKEAASALLKTRNTAQSAGKDIEKSLDGAAQAVDRLFRNAATLFALFTGGRAVKSFVSDISDADAAVGRLAKAIGSTPDAITSLGNAVARNGGSASAAAGSFERLADSINEIKATGNSSILTPLMRLQGVSQRQIRFNQDLTETFGDIADAAKGTADKLGGPMAMYMLKQAGIDRDTAALLVQGREKLNEAMEKSRRIGIVKKEDSEAAQKLQTSIESLRQTSESLGRSILTTVTPVVTDLLERFQRWIEANESWIRTGIVENVKQFATWIKGIDWDGVGKGLQEFGAGALKLAEAFGGVVKICEVLFAFWVGSKALRLVQAILGIAGLLGTGPLGWAIRLAMVGGAAMGSVDPTKSVVHGGVPSGQQNPGDELPGVDSGENRRNRGGVFARARRAVVNRMRRARGGEGGGKSGPDGIPYKADSLTQGVGISQKQYDAYREGLTDIEGKSYTQVGGSGGRYSGRYQFGPNEIRQTALQLGETPPTRAQFLADPAMQERYMERYTLEHHNYLMRQSEKYRGLSPEKKLEILGYAHNQGAGRGGALSYLESGKVGADGFGTPGTAYFGPIRKRLAELDKASPAAPTGSKTSNPDGSPLPTDGKGVNNDLMRVIKRAQEISTVKFHVHEGLRTIERQAEMYQRGWSKTMNSKHLTGRAVDLRADGDPAVGDLDSAKYAKINEAVARASKELGVPVEWGGSWKGFKDIPHFQLPDDYKSNAGAYGGDQAKVSALSAQRAGAQAAMAQVNAAQAATVSSTSNDNRSNADNSVRNDTTFNGGIHVYGNGKSGDAIANDLEQSLKRRSFAAAANRGQA